MDMNPNPSAETIVDEWWVAGATGGPQGPYELQVLTGLARSGALAPQTMVCRAGEQEWRPLGDIVGGNRADSLLPPPPPPVPGLGPSVWQASDRAGAVPTVKPLSVGMSVVLTVVTLGIWMLVWIYDAMHSYRRLSGRSGMDLNTLYWAYVGALVATFVLSLLFPVLGVLAAVGGTVVGAVLLNEMLEDRGAAAANARVPGSLHSKVTLLSLYIGTNVLAFTIIGLIVAIPMSIVYLVMFFGDHNRLAQGVAGAPVPQV